MTAQSILAGLTLLLFPGLGGCDRHEHKSLAAAKAETKRQQAACASPAAYDRLKNSIFDEAIAKRPVDRPNLDTLADYSVARMESPVVKGWDQSLDITHCEGSFILEVPPGAERGLGGARQLRAQIAYTAQPSADGAGLVYQQSGAEAIVAKLAAFDLGPVAYRPPPAIDEDQAQSNSSEQVSIPDARAPRSLPSAPETRSARNVPERPYQDQPPTSGRHAVVAEQVSVHLPTSHGASHGSPGAEGAVRTFYAALSAGNGSAAASQIIPEKRTSGPFSAGAISRFYGRLPDPLRLTSLTPAAGGYRVTYRYSAGRSHCNGVALVEVTNRGGRPLIRSIRSLSGC